MKTERIEVRVEPDKHREIKKAAKKKGWTKARLVREAIDKYLI